MKDGLINISPPGALGLEHMLGQIIQDFMTSMQRSGLSGAQIHALLYIFHADDCQVSDIATLSASSPAAASQLVERLVQHGLVERLEDPRNRRVKKLHLTEKSLQWMHEAVISNRSLVALVDALTPAQRKTVQAALGYLAQASGKIHSSHKRKVEHHAPNAQ
jgi:DNA-binding MarR family transcriptional regulator